MKPLGDGAWRIARPEGLSAADLLARLRALPRVQDVVVTENFACVYFNPAAPPNDLAEALTRPSSGSAVALPQTLTLRARYDGPDLVDVGERLALSTEEVVRRHVERTYVVQAMGFLPGFAYLGPLDDKLALPRRASPRARVTRGAIGIAAGYTAVYPYASAGGWHLIATAVDFRAFSMEDGALLHVGDRVQFVRMG